MSPWRMGNGIAASMAQVLLVMFSLCWSSLGNGEDLSPQQFAYGVRVIPRHELPLQSLLLPADLYRHRSQDGGGMRLFNSKGMVMPLDLEPLSDLPDTVVKNSLSLFALAGSTELDPQALDNLAMELRHSDGATVIQLTSASNPLPELQTEPVVAYIVALPEESVEDYRRQLRQLQFDWHQPAQGFIEGLSIETSADLTHWQPWLKGKTLARLSYQDQRIDKTSLAIEPAEAKRLQRYWRIRWHSPESVELADLQAELNPRFSPPEPLWRNVPWQRVENEPALTFDNEGRLPLTALQLKAGSDNHWLQATLYSRDNAGQPWRHRGQFSQYQLTLQGNRLSSAPWLFKANLDRHWRLEFEPSLDMRILDEQALSLGWTPDQVVFLRQGDGPYTLAWGNPTVTRTSADLTALVADFTPQQLQQLLTEPARVEDTRLLGGEGRLSPPLSWRPWVLWASLLAAVAVMLWMATSLWRQMQSVSGTR